MQSKWLGKTQVHRQEEGEGIHVGESTPNVLVPKGNEGSIVTADQLDHA